MDSTIITAAIVFIVFLAIIVLVGAEPKRRVVKRGTEPSNDAANGSWIFTPDTSVDLGAAHDASPCDSGHSGDGGSCH